MDLQWHRTSLKNCCLRGVHKNNSTHSVWDQSYSHSDHINFRQRNKKRHIHVKKGNALNTDSKAMLVRRILESNIRLKSCRHHGPSTVPSLHKAILARPGRLQMAYSTGKHSLTSHQVNDHFHWDHPTIVVVTRRRILG